MSPELLGGIFGLACLAFAWEIFVRAPEDVEVVRAKIALPGLPTDLIGRRIFFLSDLHHRAQVGFREAWVFECLKRSEADLWIFGGDLVECAEGTRHFFHQLEGIPLPPLGGFAVHGNNESRHADCPGLEARYRDLGIRVLNNASQLCQSSKEPYAIAGVLDASIHLDDLPRALEGIPEGIFTLLISHSPEAFPEAKQRGVGLVFSGHTHGGQVRFPWIGALWTDTPRTGRKYQVGLYPEGESLLVLSKGVGTSKLPIRWLARPEVWVLELARSTSGKAEVLQWTPGGLGASVSPQPA